MDQLQTDTRLRMRYPGVRPGDVFVLCGKQVQYTGLDLITDQLDYLSRGYGDLVDTRNVSLMMSDPLGFVPPTYQIDPTLIAALSGNVSDVLDGAIGGALYGALASINDPFCGPQYTSKSQIENAIKGALVGGAAGALAGVASNFLPPGLDAPVQAVKGVIGKVTKQLPFNVGGAADIVNKIVAVKTLLNVAVKGPTSLIFAAVKSNFLSDIPGAGDLAKVVNLQSEVASLAGLAGNAAAFAAQAANIARTFPMINVNKLASNMITGAVAGALGGAGFNIKSMVPNMVMAGGIVKMLPIPGITPSLDAMAPIKTAAPPKPKPPVQLKNLFAEAAAGSAMATLKQPLSQFMGIRSTIAPQSSLTADSAAKTSYNQKLNGNANTVNWGSGGYARNTTAELQEKRRMEISAKIEKETQELLSQVDYSKLTKYSYQDLVKKHPRIKPTTPVLEALAIIDEDEAAEAAKANTAITTA